MVGIVVVELILYILCVYIYWGFLGMWVGLVWIQGFVSVLFLYFWGYKRLIRSLIWFGSSDYSVCSFSRF